MAAFKILIINLLVFSFFTAKAIEADSISTLQKNGQTVILYEVGAKETMYSIARKYNIPPKSIIAINPEIQNEGLKVGQKIFVPYETARANKVSNTQNNNEETSGTIYHTVERGQTLYSVGRIYKSNIDDIKKWNGLNSNELKVGSKIIVRLSNTESADAETKPNKIEAVSVSSETSKKTSRSNTGYDKIVERGKADVFNVIDGENYYFAQHKTLPAGTIIKINNEKTGISIYARVVERMPETTDKSIVVKLSKLAYKNLGGETTPLITQLEYLP